jgi:4-alpha-glucanotransferase
MNVPASASNNWQWRCIEKDFNEKIAIRLRDLVEMYGRN